jgi:hypothetical protein
MGELPPVVGRRSGGFVEAREHALELMGRVEVRRALDAFGGDSRVVELEAPPTEAGGSGAG